MNEITLRVRANRNSGDLEIEGPPDLVNEWWEKLWPTLNQTGRGDSPPIKPRVGNAGNLETPEVFGEFFHEFRSDITDVDRILVAASFVQSKDADRSFTTKAANQVLLDQNIKVANPSQSVRRLLEAKRAFAISEGRFRVSSTGFEHLNSLKLTAEEK
jgi:hypothetical protein